MAVDYTNLQKMAQQYQPQQPIQPNPQKPKSGIGCVLLVFFLAFSIGMALLIYFWVYPTYFSGESDKEITVVDKKTGKEKSISKKSSMDGILMSAIISPDDEGNNNLWVMTYKYKSSKYIINTYIYNPEKNKILKNFETESTAFPSLSKLYCANKEVWKINSSTTGIEAGIYVYDPLSGEEKLNTRGFCDKYLQSGISNLWVIENPLRINIETKDGRKPVFNIEEGKIYDNVSDYSKAKKDDKEIISIFSLGVEKSGEEARKKLYLVSGPKSNLQEKNISESYFSNPSTLKFFTKSEAKPLNDKVYLEGIMPYQDDECCFVFHQTQTGNEAERILTCIDKKGNTLWSVSTEDDLFPSLRATQKDAFSTMFFIKNNIHVFRSNELVLFVYDRYGFIGFDFQTGEKQFDQILSK